MRSRSRVGTIRLPPVFNPNRAEYRRDVARSLGNAKLHRPERPTGRRQSPGAHPVESDPELRQRMRAAGQAERLERELVDLTSRVDGHNQSLAREFDRVLEVLDRRGLRRHRGVGAHRPRLGAGAAVPRIRPARRRVPAAGSPRRPRRGDARRAAVGVRLRAPQPRTGAAAVVPVGGCPRPLAPHPGDERGPRCRRALDRPRRAPPAGSGVRRRRLRLGPRGGSRRGRRRRRR